MNPFSATTLHCEESTKVGDAIKATKDIVVEKVVAPVVGVSFDGTGETVKWRRAFEQFAHEQEGVKSVAVSFLSSRNLPQLRREARRGCLSETSSAGRERVVRTAAIAALMR